MANEFRARNGLIAPTIQATAETGIAPLQIQSTTVVNNLNADLLDGKHASDFALADHEHPPTFSTFKLKSPNGTEYLLSVTNDGILTVSPA